mgnify:CR=1 FL=1
MKEVSKKLWYLKSLSNKSLEKGVEVVFKQSGGRRPSHLKSSGTSKAQKLRSPLAGGTLPVLIF